MMPAHFTADTWEAAAAALSVTVTVALWLCYDLKNGLHFLKLLFIVILQR